VASGQWLVARGSVSASVSGQEEVRSQEPGARSRESGVGSQESEVRSQKSEVRSQKSEVRSQNTEYRTPNSEPGTLNSEPPAQTLPLLLTLLFRLECAGSQVTLALFKDAPLAQLAEQVTLNHWVVGSIPTRCMAQYQGLTE
jgi:hypothetical protein